MALNVEVKARVRDMVATQRRVEALAGGPAARLLQEDLFFAVPRGRLKVRAQLGCPTEAIYYRRGNETGPAVSAYYRRVLSNPARDVAEFDRLFGRRGVVFKERSLYWLEGARVHLDKVEGLGYFLEIEVPAGGPEDLPSARATAERLTRVLDLRADELVSLAYDDLLWGAGPATGAIV